MQKDTDSTKNSEMMHTKMAMTSVLRNMRGKFITSVSVNSCT